MGTSTSPTKFSEEPYSGDRNQEIEAEVKEMRIIPIHFTQEARTHVTVGKIPSLDGFRYIQMGNPSQRYR